MTVREAASVLRRRIWWVIIPLVLALGASTACLYLMTPVYRATTTVMVLPPSGSAVTYDTLLYNRTLAKTYVELARSLSVARLAVSRLDLTVDPEDLRDRTAVSVVRDTEVIAIGVEDTDPQQAARLANTVAEVFQDQFHLYTTQATLGVIDAAIPPVRAVRPHPLLYTAVALACGLTAGVALAFLVEHVTAPLATAQVVPAPKPPASTQQE